MAGGFYVWAEFAGRDGMVFAKLLLTSCLALFLLIAVRDIARQLGPGS